MADYESVDSRNGIRETGVNLDRESVVPTLFRPHSKGKRDRDQNVVQTLRDRQRTSPWNRWKVSWLGRPRRETGSAKIIRSWGWSWGEELGKEKFVTSLFKRSIKNMNLNDSSDNKQVDGQIKLRELKSVCMVKLELRNKLFQENHARVWQEIVELRKVCCEEQIEQDKHELMSCLCIKRGILRQWVNCWLKRRNFRKFLVKRKRILRSRSREKLLERPLLFRVPESCRAAILDCRTIHGMLFVLQETLFERLLAWEAQASTFFNNSKNLESSSQELRSDITGTTRRQESEIKKRTVEHVNAFTPVPEWRWWSKLSKEDQSPRVESLRCEE